MKGHFTYDQVDAVETFLLVYCFLESLVSSRLESRKSGVDRERKGVRGKRTKAIKILDKGFIDASAYEGGPVR